MKRQKNFFIHKMIPLVLGGEEIGYEFQGGMFEEPYFTEPTKGKHDYKTCDGCQKQFKQVYDTVKTKFDTFPKCCKKHEKLLNESWFELTKFREIDVPKMVAEKLIFSYQHILNTIESDDYFDDIRDYIDYTLSSFGDFPNELGPPLFIMDYLRWLTNKIEVNEDLPSERRNYIIGYIRDIQNGRPKENTDLGLLISTYDKWFNLFPFNLSFFSHLKSKFEKQIPIISEPLHTNRYDGMQKARLHTKTSLVQVLISLTNKLLTEINVLTLKEKGDLTDAEKTKLELIIESRRLKLKKGYIKTQGEEKEYYKILNDWFHDEKKFINEIIPLIKHEPIEVKMKFSLLQIALIFHYEGKQITRQNHLEVARSYGHNSGEKLFQLYTKFSSRQNRVGSENTQKKNINKLKLFEFVISHLSETARPKAIDEMNTFKASFE